MSIVKGIKSEFNCWYMDDGTIGGTVQQLIADFDKIVAEGLKLGLVVIVRKCEIITDDSSIVKKFQSVVPDIKHVK